LETAPKREYLEPNDEPVKPRVRPLGQGALESPSGAFTLEHTKVDITVTGFMQEVTVTQRFKNPFSAPIEALYAFPLPDDAAVHEMTLVAGARTIKAQVKKRFEARQLYEQAKAEGRRAALLDQERPNVFTQSVANLLPGEAVLVTVSYVAPLAFDEGVYTLDFPMTVGPRFIPDTGAVPDADQVTPPQVRGGRDIEVSVKLDAGSVIETLWSVSHRLILDRPSSREARLSLDPSDSLPNKDLIVRWRVSGPETRAAMLASGGAFALMINPEIRGANPPATPKELVFLIDTSCSMSGAPLDAAKGAMRLALQELTPNDTFMLIDFAQDARVFSEQPLPATPLQLERAMRHLDALPAAGGTNQLAGIRKALERPEDPERLRMVLLMTDGYIGNEDQIFAETSKRLGSARLFGFGIGSSVNHHLLARLSEVGRGFYQFVPPDENPAEPVKKFARRIRQPLLTDVTIDWGTLPVADVMPGPVPDLFDAQPLLIQGRYREAAKGTVLVRGKRAGQAVTIEVPVTLPETSSSGRVLSMAWARRRLQQLSMEEARGVDQSVAITALALEHHLASKYTSLVAVDETRVADGTTTTTVTEPALVPDQTVQTGMLKIIGGGGAIMGLGLSGTGAGGGGLGSGGSLSKGGNALLGNLGAPLMFGGGGGASGVSTADALGVGGLGTKGAGRGSGNRFTFPSLKAPRGLYAPGVFEALLKRRANHFQYCFEQDAFKTPAVKRTIILQWRIEADGSISNVEVVTKEHAQLNVTACLIGAVRRITFPAHAGGPVTVKVPLMFQPE
jgi:Ca-activated chloride channel family protein